ncbi:MAG: YqeG family HAD IIIA-type phosphatase [Coprothermobacterota bacterium]|nr:YqeG family HAD IIIA-type phosphatase [Coprothermobacterota bacterium]
MNPFFPDAFFPRVEEIEPAFLHQQGLQGVIVDLDNTLAPRHCAVCPPSARAWLDRLKADGFRLLLLSNSPSRRVRQYEEQTGVPSIPSAMKPLFGAHGRAIRRLSLPPSRVAVIGDQIYTDILGGNLAGAYTILVGPLSKGSDHLWTKLVRWVEKPVLHAYFKRHP